MPGQLLGDLLGGVQEGGERGRRAGTEALERGRGMAGEAIERGRGFAERVRGIPPGGSGTGPIVLITYQS